MSLGVFKQEDPEMRQVVSGLQDHEKRIRVLEGLSHRFSGMVTLLVIEIPIVATVATAFIVAFLKKS